MNNELIKYTLILGLIALISSGILVFTNKITEIPIKAAEKVDFLAGLNAVLPEFNNMPDDDAIDMDGNTVYIAKLNQVVVGYAVKSTSSKGYSGDITVIVGALPDGKVYGVKVLKHAETPGLGDKISSGDFLKSFSGKSLSDTFGVKKDGGDIDQFSGATISPRAVCDAVNNANVILEKVIYNRGE